MWTGEWIMARKSLDDLGELQRAVQETIWEMGEGTVHQVRERLAKEESRLHDRAVGPAET